MATYASRTLIKIKTAKMNNNISVERLEKIERERQQTLSDPLYREWLQALNVSGSYTDQSLIYNARQAMQEWDSTRFNIEPVNRLCM